MVQSPEAWLDVPTDIHHQLLNSRWSFLCRHISKPYLVCMYFIAVSRSSKRENSLIVGASWAPVGAVWYSMSQLSYPIVIWDSSGWKLPCQFPPYNAGTTHGNWSTVHEDVIIYLSLTRTVNNSSKGGEGLKSDQRTICLRLCYSLLCSYPYRNLPKFLFV